VISLEDWALIRHFHRSEKLSQRAIAKQLGVARATVAAALASDGPPRYERAPVESAISAAEPRIRALLSVYPQMPATVIAERVGWSGSTMTKSFDRRLDWRYLGRSRDVHRVIRRDVIQSCSKAHYLVQGCASGRLGVPMS
jgi:DNA-binding MarR family transcriptional regulator